MSEIKWWEIDYCAPYVYQSVKASDAQFVVENEVIDSIVKEYREKWNIPGCAIGVTDGKNIRLLRTYGFSRRPYLRGYGWGVATPSPVGSISKTITALSVLSLHERGISNIDEQLTENPRFPEFLKTLIPDSWRRIRLRHLLGHTSGLPGGNPKGGISSEVQLKYFWSLITGSNGGHEHPGEWPYRTLPVLSGSKLSGFYSSGASARYSNIGYQLLAAVVDCLTLFDQQLPNHQRGYAKFTNNFLLEAGGMVSPCLAAYWKTVPGMTKGYGPGDGGLKEKPSVLTNSKPTTIHSTRWWAGPGGWTMTIGDLTRLLTIIHSAKGIPPDLRDEMLTHAGSTNSNFRHGLGVHIENDQSWYTGGDIGGWSAYAGMWRGESISNPPVGLAVMCNGGFKPGGTAGTLSGIRSSDLRELCLDIKKEVDGPGGVLGDLSSAEPVPSPAARELISRFGEAGTRGVVASVLRTLNDGDLSELDELFEQDNKIEDLKAAAQADDPDRLLTSLGAIVNDLHKPLATDEDDDDSTL